MNISVIVQSTEKRGLIYDKALCAYFFPPACCNGDEHVQEIELYGVIDSHLDNIFIVNEHCVAGWLDLEVGFTDRSQAEEYARAAMKMGAIGRGLSKDGSIPYRRVDSRAVRNRIQSLALADVKEYLAMIAAAKAKLAAAPVTPVPMTVSVNLV